MSSYCPALFRPPKSGAVYCCLAKGHRGEHLFYPGKKSALLNELANALLKSEEKP